jgi:hypothetical protein
MILISYVELGGKPIYTITTIILLIAYCSALICLLISGFLHVYFRMPWKFLDHTFWFFMIHVIIVIWIRSTIFYFDIIMLKVNLFLFFIAQLMIYLAGILYLFSWIGLYHSYSNITRIQDYDIIYKCIILGSVLSIPLIILALSTVIVVEVSIIPLQLTWGYLAISGLLLLVPFSYYGYLIIKIIKINGREIPKFILIIWLFMTIATPMAITLLFVYAVKMSYIETIPWLACLIQLLIGLSDTVMILFISFSKIFRFLRVKTIEVVV